MYCAPRLNKMSTHTPLWPWAWLWMATIWMAIAHIISCDSAMGQDCPSNTTTTATSSCSTLLPCYLPSLDHLPHVPPAPGHAPLAPGHNATLHIVLCNDSSELEKVLTFREMYQVLIRGGASERHVVKCGRNESGLEFMKVRSVHLENIVLVGCGFIRNHSSDNLRLTTSMLVIESSEVTLEGVTVFNAVGMGVWLLAVNYTDISSCVFERTFTGEMFAEQRSGLFLQVDQNNTSHHIRSCQFVASCETTPLQTADNVTHGGGMSISLRNHSFKNLVSVTNCTFECNMAEVGGAVSISIQDSSSSNAILITGSEFKGNTATEKGGAIAASFLPSLKNDISPRHNKMAIAGCNFTGNKASVGGALHLSLITGTTSCAGKGNEIEFAGCSWTENEAISGAAIDARQYVGTKWFVDNSNTNPIVLKDCNFEHNVVKWSGHQRQRHYGEGTMRIQNSELRITGYLKLHGNTGSAIYLESSIVTFMQNSVSTFTDNVGYRGAAIALMECRSTIRISDNSTILFHGNEAHNDGGAIYQQHSKSCFIIREEPSGEESAQTWNNGAQMEFYNNTATAGNGESVFVSSLQPCMESYKTDNYLEALNSIANITFVATDNETHQISTFGRVLFSKPLDSAVPGKETDLEVWMEDDTNTWTLPYLQIVTSDSLHARVVTGYTYEGRKKLKFHGEPGSVVQLKISPIYLQALELRINVTLADCPPGYYYDSVNTTCICSGNSQDGAKRYIGIQTCNPFTFQATLQHSHWAGYVTDESNNKTVLMTSFCTRGFCARSAKTHKDIILPSDTSDYDLSRIVCSQNRTGILCARCRENHSVFFPTFHSCKRNRYCELGWIFYIFSQVIPTTLLFSIIIALDVNLISGALGSVIFYIQSFDLLLLTGNDFLWFETPIYRLINGLRLISRMSNLRFFAMPETAFCIWEGASSLDVIAFNYVTYTYALFLVIFTVKCVKPCLHQLRIKCSRRVDHRTGKLTSGKHYSTLSGSIIHGLTGFLVLCYSQSTFISLHLIAHTKLYGLGSNASENLVFYNGELKAFKGKHLVYALPATFFLVTITILPPLLLLCYPLCYRILALCRLQESKLAKLLCMVVPLERYKPFFDSFQGSFKDEHRYFAGLFFSYRLVILLTFAYVRVVATYYVILEIELVVMLALHAWVQPHKKNWHNWLDVFIFLLLLVINGCSIYTYHQRADYTYNTPYITTVNTFQVLIAYLPHLYALGYVVVETVVLVRKKLQEREGGLSESQRLQKPLDSRDQLEEMLLSRAGEPNTSLLRSVK